jgi:hypothetical protein
VKLKRVKLLCIDKIMKKIFFNDRFIAFGSDDEINEYALKSEIYELKSLTDIPSLLNKFLPLYIYKKLHYLKKIVIIFVSYHIYDHSLRRASSPRSYTKKYLILLFQSDD